MRPPAAPLELWGGIECTVNRVGEAYLDQLERNGHARRASDLELIAGLGVRTLRYPILWERTAPDGVERADWRWADERLRRLRELGMRPIVGLVHHGSGPRDTSLVDRAWPEKLARYARAVAERYPWVTDWTPVNEPLTTARFSGLYGFWYPHARDERSFVRALVHQCLGTVRAMEEIRAVNPVARLVLTEDFGVTHATPLLAYQARFENQRRLLSMDLLCGRVDRAHPLWGWLRAAGAGEEELEELRRARPPDVLGLNHYVTSDRMLDERMGFYPAWSHGGNGRHRYADVEAVRAHADGFTGHERVLVTVGERYGIPVALTEVHLGGEREQQLRWLLEAWRGARKARERVDVEAVTVWSMFGAYDWDCLVTQKGCHYESGVFDVRSGEPRPTALVTAVRALARGSLPRIPAAVGTGWWRRRERLVHGPLAISHLRTAAKTTWRRNRQQLVVLGGGTLGRAFERICVRRGLPVRLVTRGEADILDAGAVTRVLRESRAWAVVNAAGYVRVDDAEREPDRCHRENFEGAAAVAAVCRDENRPLVTFSSDLVFGDVQERTHPYVEPDPVSPLNVYGRSKALAEHAVLQTWERALVVRTSAFFGPWDAHNFVTLALARLAEREGFSALEDVIVSPTYVPDLVNKCLDLVIDGERGLCHVANADSLTWADLARLAARMAGLDGSLIEPRPLVAAGLAAARPRFSALSSARGVRLPGVDDALARYLVERSAA